MKSLAERRAIFLDMFNRANRKYGNSTKRLAADGWRYPWQTLITTIYSAQSRDEVTIDVMERTFSALPTLQAFADAPLSKIMRLTRSMNYYKTKSKHAKQTAQMLITQFDSKVPVTIEELVTLPGVGRKTANLILTEVHQKPGITVDTHVHRILNVLGIVETKTPHQTELELQKVAPRKYWKDVNRLLVLW
ncbi:MAG: endonuclease III, partial [Candidatus Diapherotrites archaeon]|nr:endonuclease III [Candidatus Diapherotrites archaeon]